MSPFRRPRAKHTRTELPSTRLPCTSFPHAPLGPLNLSVHFSSSLQQHMGVLYTRYVFFRILLTADGPRRAINRLHPHIQQRGHLACGREASSYLTLSATETRTKYLILSRHDLSRLRTSDEEVTRNTSSTRAKQADRAYVMMSSLFSSSLQQRMEGR